MIVQELTVAIQKQPDVALLEPGNVIENALVKMIKKKLHFYFYCIILNILVVISVAFGADIQIVLCTLMINLMGGYLLRNSPMKNNWITYLLVFGFYTLLTLSTFIASFFYSGYLGLPIFIATSLCTVLTIALKKQSKKLKFVYNFLSLIIALLIIALLPNYYNYLVIKNQDQSIINNSIHELVFLDINNNKIDSKIFKNKIIVLDVWDSSCSKCIEDFPKFEKLKDEFENDSSIKFYALNLLLKRDDKLAISKYTDNYSFNKLYAGKNVRKQLKIKSIPKYIIVNKKGKIEYIGSLNTGKTEFYKNFYSILSEIKNENN